MKNETTKHITPEKLKQLGNGVLKDLKKIKC